MKFYQVPIGQQFKYQGDIYTKSGPLTAHTENNQQNKLLPRSVNVERLNNMESSETGPLDERLLPVKEIIAALEIYHNHCVETLSAIQSYTDKDTFENIQIKQDIAYKALLDSLK